MIEHVLTAITFARSGGGLLNLVLPPRFSTAPSGFSLVLSNITAWKSMVGPIIWVAFCLFFSVIQGYTMDVICSTGFGIDVNSQRNPDNPFIQNAKLFLERDISASPLLMLFSKFFFFFCYFYLWKVLEPHLILSSIWLHWWPLRPFLRSWAYGYIKWRLGTVMRAEGWVHGFVLLSLS